MSIYLYSGTPGSGKSLHAASDIRLALNRANTRPVLGNFELAQNAPVKHPEFFRYYPNHELTPDRITDYADWFWTNSGVPFREDYIILCIDECQLLFNSREWTNKDRMRWLEFFSQHRKYGVRVLFIAQADKMVDNQFRMMIEYEVKHRKLSNFGVWGALIGALFLGRLFLHVTYYYAMKERLETDWYVAKKADMRMYDSYKRFQRTEG